MRYIKRVVFGILLIFFLVVFLCGFKINDKDYSDLKEGSWYINNVIYVVRNGLMTGVSNTSFGPETKLTRAMIAQILYNLDRPEEIEYPTSFTDVLKNSWYYNAVSWAEHEGIMSGYGNNRFGPNDYLTREQLATVLYNYSNDSIEYLDSYFTDTDKISSWAKESISWAYQNKIISGYGDGTVRPKGVCTRAEAATMIRGYCSKINLEDLPQINIEESSISKGYGVVDVVYHGEINKVRVKVSHSSGRETVYSIGKDKKCSFTFPYGPGEYVVSLYENTYGTKYKKVLEKAYYINQIEYNRSLIVSSSYYDYKGITGVLNITSRLWNSSLSDYNNAKNLYNWITDNIKYDSNRAKTVESGYYPDLSLLVDKKRGICLDIASLYCSMLRSQGIESQIIIGNHSWGYHAWCTALLDGKWVLIDPTFGATSIKVYKHQYFDMSGSVALQYREDDRC